MILRIISVFILSIGLHHGSANAQTFTGYEIDAGIAIPTQLGARFKAFFNDTTYVAGGLGYSPSFLKGATENMILGANSDGAKILAEAIADSFIIDIRAGYQEKVDSGFYFEGGYSYYSGGNGIITEEEYNDYDNSLFLTFDDYKVKSDLHTLNAYAGYVFKLSDLVLKAEAGIVKPISSNNTFEAENVFLATFTRDIIEDEISDLWSKAFILNVGLHVIFPL